MNAEAGRFRALIEAAFPDLAIRTCRFLAEGWDSTVWEVNDAFVFRFPKRAEVAVWLRTEIALLPALAPVLPVPVPHFTYCAGPSAAFPYPFVGYRKLPGVSLAEAPPALIHSERLAAQIGAVLSALHRFPVARAIACGVERQTPEMWRDQYAAFLTDIRTLFPRMTPAERERTEALFGAYLDEPVHLRFEPTLLHQDLGGEHILLDPETGDCSGVIDWGDITIGDPAQDFCGFPAAWLPMLLAHYRRPVDPTFTARVAFYRALGPYHLLRFGLRVGGEPFIAQGHAALRAVSG
jgi:aminoglycoside phosphotransferase (APT) family kinase protein